MTLTLFYDSLTRSGAIADISAAGVATKKVFPAGSFAAWTHVAAAGSLLFFYDQNSGDAWTLTKEVGMKLGETAEDGLKTIADVAGDVYGAGKELVGDAYQAVTDFFGL